MEPQSVSAMEPSPVKMAAQATQTGEDYEDEDDEPVVPCDKELMDRVINLGVEYSRLESRTSHLAASSNSKDELIQALQQGLHEKNNYIISLNEKIQAMCALYQEEQTSHRKDMKEVKILQDENRRLGLEVEKMQAMLKLEASSKARMHAC